MAVLSDEELDLVSGGTAESGPFFTYTIRKNETLSTVAMRFGTAVDVLIRINNLKSLSEIKPGTTLSIPQN